MLECERQNLPLNWHMITAAANEFAQKFEYEENTFKSSNGWKCGFKKRFDIKLHRTHGEAASADFAAISSELPGIITKLRGYKSSDVYNMDETAILYCNPPLTTIGSRRIQGMKQDKSRMTVALTVNADGSDFREPLIIGKSINPRCFGRNKTGNNFF